MTVIPVRRLLDLVANAFPLWVLLACGLALVEPGLFSWFRGPAIVWALAVIMLGMGLTLSVNDFTRITSRPLAVVTGLIAQFLIMPAAGWGVATLMELDTPLAVGLILVACCPGGTASNVVTYIARAFGHDATIARTISIEVHSVIGSLLAGWWRLTAKEQTEA